jgi:hypothetical protein
MSDSGTAGPNSAQQVMLEFGNLESMLTVAWCSEDIDVRTQNLHRKDYGVDITEPLAWVV